MSKTVLRIGYWLPEKKLSKLNMGELARICCNKGYELVQIDLTKPLEEQGPFHIIFHKLIEIIVKANSGESEALNIIHSVEQYLSTHVEVCIVDPLDKVRRLLDRYRSYSVIKCNERLAAANAFTPPSVELTSNNVAQNLQTLKSAGVQFPIVCKPSVSHGSSAAHEMALIFNEAGLGNCRIPAVAQQFVNHNAVLFKIYCVASDFYIVERPSFKNFYSNDQPTINFSSHDVSKSDSKSSWTQLDSDDPYRDVQVGPLDQQRLKVIVDVVCEEVGLLLMGIDVVIEVDTNRYAIIDINAYPGYDGFPNFFDSLTKCLIEAMETHKSRLQTSLEEVSSGVSSPICDKPFSITSNRADYDDSGFDTSDSSDEKKKNVRSMTLC